MLHRGPHYGQDDPAPQEQEAARIGYLDINDGWCWPALAERVDPEPVGVPVWAVAGILGACGSNVGADDDLDRAPIVAESQRCPACQGIVCGG